MFVKSDLIAYTCDMLKLHIHAIY